jgi:hypothetical protein
VAEETEVSGEVANTAEKPLTEPPVKAPADGPEMNKLLKRAAKGDESCLPQVQALLADKERGSDWMEAAGSPAAWFRQSLVNKMGADNVFAKEAAKQKLERVQADLEGPNPTPIERLLAERASLCWFAVNWYEERFINANEMSLTQADYFQRRIHRTHQRFLSAVETLARVRKMAGPTLQVNIARNQVNMAGACPTGGSP